MNEKASLPSRILAAIGRRFMNQQLQEIEQIRSILWDLKGNIGDVQHHISDVRDRISQVSQNNVQETDELKSILWDLKGNISDIREHIPNMQLDRRFAQMHQHIDFVQRDILVALQSKLQFIAAHDVKLITEHPVAINSNDHLVPHGTARDNTRYPRFIRKCETLFPADRELAFLDLGCSGGGMVLEAILRGHFALGLEGSDYSLKQQRAEWRLLKNNLYTCDITKEFTLQHHGSGQVMQFDIITAWEVLEHLPEGELPIFFENIKNHLKSDGYFIASIAIWDDIDPETGINWHQTVKPQVWWEHLLDEHGFTLHKTLLNPLDLARGGCNPPTCYELPYPDLPEEQLCFAIAVSPKA